MCHVWVWADVSTEAAIVPTTFPPFTSSIFTWVPGLPVDDHAIAYGLPRTHDTPVVGAVTPIAPLMVPVITAPMFWNAPLSGRHRARRFPGPRFG